MFVSIYVCMYVCMCVKLMEQGSGWCDNVDESEVPVKNSLLDEG